MMTYDDDYIQFPKVTY